MSGGILGIIVAQAELVIGVRRERRGRRGRDGPGRRCRVRYLGNDGILCIALLLLVFAFFVLPFTLLALLFALTLTHLLILLVFLRSVTLLEAVPQTKPAAAGSLLGLLQRLVRARGGLGLLLVGGLAAHALEASRLGGAQPLGLLLNELLGGAQTVLRLRTPLVRELAHKRIVLVVRRVGARLRRLLLLRRLALGRRRLGIQQGADVAELVVQLHAHLLVGIAGLLPLIFGKLGLGDDVLHHLVLAARRTVAVLIIKAGKVRVARRLLVDFACRGQLCSHWRNAVSSAISSRTMFSQHGLSPPLAQKQRGSS